MGVLCWVAGHAPQRAPIFNGAYKFGRCRRCGRDIVQSATSGWTIPAEGFRVSWREPGNRGGAERPASQSQTTAKGRPRDDDFSWTRASAPEARVAGLRDFMEDAPVRVDEPNAPSPARVRSTI